MIDFFRLHLSLIVIWGCFLASLFLLKNKPWKHPWTLFKYYLLIVVVVETLSSVGLRFHLMATSQWLYNGFMPLYGLFYFYVFANIIKLKHIKKLILVLSLTFLGAILWEGFNVGFSTFFFRTLIYVSLVQLFLCGLYFYSIFQQDEYSDLLKDPAFWFSTGTLFYVAIVASTSIFFSELLKLQVKNQIPLRAILVVLGNVIMYGCWIKSFLCINNKQTYITQSYSQR